MAENISTPRITAQLLDSFVGQNVMVVGKVVQLRGDSAIIDSQGNVTIILNREAHLTTGNSVLVIGKVTPDLSIKSLSATDVGPDVDLELYKSVVDATHQFPDIFKLAS